VTSSDEARFATLYERYHRKVAAYCRRRADADQVDDLVADVFLTAWRKIDDVPEGEETLPWLYQVAYLVLTNHWRGIGRKKRLQEKMETLGLPTTRPLLHDQVVMREELREVLAAAQGLKPKDQEILRLSLWEHLSHEEIGKVLNINPNTAKQRLHRAREALVREHGRITAKARSQRSPAAHEGGEW
jgi:RNA polymerase sigma-70 factor (ECF subfamily)